MERSTEGMREVEAGSVPPKGPHATYIRELNSLNTAVLLVDPTKSIKVTNQSEAVLRASLRQAVIKKHGKITTFSERSAQCELGLEKYRTVQKLMRITEREAVCDIPVITYNLPNDSREEKIQCELGVEALSTTKTLKFVPESTSLRHGQG
ncbi:hypothetical protein GE061_011035 [Apolygus lucorum]|uniref:Uncharacterized protein n=1 Tax=Apolygus lucorum TaxID=248454 RepID=A0A8S9XYZ4_APOLU|nr:hypothetical protein GE061_011035 [Apolygus lucorum]